MDQRSKSVTRHPRCLRAKDWDGTPEMGTSMSDVAFVIVTNNKVNDAYTLRHPFHTASLRYPWLSLFPQAPRTPLHSNAIPRAKRGRKQITMLIRIPFPSQCLARQPMLRVHVPNPDSRSLCATMLLGMLPTARLSKSCPICSCSHAYMPQLPLLAPVPQLPSGPSTDTMVFSCLAHSLI